MCFASEKLPDLEYIGKTFLSLTIYLPKNHCSKRSQIRHQLKYDVKVYSEFNCTGNQLKRNENIK